MEAIKKQRESFVTLCWQGLASWFVISK